MAEVTILRTRQEIEDDEPVLPSDPVLIGSPIAFAPAPDPISNDQSVTIAESPNDFFGEPPQETVNAYDNVQLAPGGEPVNSDTPVIYTPPDEHEWAMNPVRSRRARASDQTFGAGNHDVNITGRAVPISNHPEAFVFGRPQTPGAGGVINSGGTNVQFSRAMTINPSSDLRFAASRPRQEPPPQEGVSFLGRSALTVGGTEVTQGASGHNIKTVNQDSVTFGGRGTLNVGGGEVHQTESRGQDKVANSEHAAFGARGVMNVGGVEVRHISPSPTTDRRSLWERMTKKP